MALGVAREGRIELPFVGSRPTVLPLDDSRLVPGGGIEPPDTKFRASLAAAAALVWSGVQESNLPCHASKAKRPALALHQLVRTVGVEPTWCPGSEPGDLPLVHVLMTSWKVQDETERYSFSPAIGVAVAVGRSSWRRP